MLGYDAHIHTIRSDVTSEDLHRLRQISYRERINYLQALTAERLIHVPYRTWVDHLIRSTTEGRGEILHDGGYPYVFHATGAEIKANFAASGVEAIDDLADATWYLVEAWDQS